MDLTRWDVADARVAHKASRIASTVLANLGAAFGKEPQPKPERFTCMPISLAKHYTASLRDETAGDGKGGWTDQGDNDMRDLPVGRLTFAGVLYEVGNGCIALRSPQHLPHAPPSVDDVPVGGQPVEQAGLSWTECSCLCHHYALSVG